MAQGTIIPNPKVPFGQNLGSVKEKQIFYIVGVPDPNPRRFAVRFYCGNDIVFNIGVRFNFGNERNVMLRNTRTNGFWTEAERSLQGNFPFQPGKSFDIVICVETSCFKKIPFIQKLGSEPIKDVWNSSPKPEEKVPFRQNIGSVKEKQVFYVVGVPDPNPSKFNFGNERNVIVRNTLTNHIWGEEERFLQGNFPFQPSKSFDITICVETSCFKVGVNGQLMFEFKHRVPFNLIERLTIHGDVRIIKYARC